MSPRSIDGWKDVMLKFIASGLLMSHDGHGLVIDAQNHMSKRA